MSDPSTPAPTDSGRPLAPNAAPPALESPLLRNAGFRHAFFTRAGGVSEGPFGALNFSAATGDDPARVQQNLTLGAQALGVPLSRLYFLNQVHGVDSHSLEGHEDRVAVLETSGDALLSGTPGVACGVRTADCVPILLADERTGWVAAVHAGWRGAAQNIARHVVEHLRRAGATGPLLAAIGPHISLEAFEVSDDVANELLQASPDPAVVSRALGPRPHVDLRRLVRAQLSAAGVTAIDDVFGCTLSDTERFFSFRRDGKRGGRHLSAIVPR